MARDATAAAHASLAEREIVGLVAVNSPAFVEASFAAQATGQITVPLRSEGDQSRISAASVTRIVTPAAGSGWRHIPFDPPQDDAVAQILFTSGTTGEAKGIALTNANIADTTQRLNAVMSLEASVREYVGVPVFYSFGIGRCRAVSAAGGAWYIPPRGFDPIEIAAMLKAGEINAISAVPTLWRLVLAAPDGIAPYAGAVKWIEIGSQSMSRTEKEGLKALFPNAVIVQHYGLTEASRASFLSLHTETGPALDSVGAAVGQTEIKISADQRIMIRGPHVAPLALTGAGYRTLTDPDGWLTTEDLGALEDGRLVYRGRADDLINCGGVKILPDALETPIRQALGGDGLIAVARLSDPMRGDAILVAHTRDYPSDAVQAAAIAAAAALGLQAAGAIKLLAIDALPVTDTGKVRRAALAELYAATAVAPATPTDGPEDKPASDLAGLETQLLAIWREALGRDDVTVNQGFYDVGGDSLSAVGVALGMEKAGFPPELAHGIFDGLSIAEIARRQLRASAPPSALEQQLLSIWRDALGREDVTVDQGFYDVGGDSLSAVSVALGMEKAGFAPEIAHGIFDGKSIAQLCQDLEPAAMLGEAPTPAKSEIAILGEASNFIKGIVFLCMVASHWAPIYLLALHLRFGPVGQAMAPIFSLGSPTLAFAFGTGIALFHQRQLDVSPPAFRRNIRLAIWLLGGGLVVGAATELLSDWVQTGDVDAADALTALLSGGPFFFYLLATLSIPLWLPALKRGLGSALNILLIAAGIYALYLGLGRVLPPAGEDRIYATVRDTLVGHWSLFQMSAIVLIGVAVGLILEARLSAGGKLRGFLRHGLLLMAGGLIMSAAAGDLVSWISFPKPITLWAIVFYSGLAITILATFETLSERIAGLPPVRGAVAWICCAGILLFPLYVVQSLVFHGSQILSHYTGLSPPKALTAMILVFTAAVAQPLWRVYKLYYAGRK